ncbi:neuromedin-U receptor 1 [Xyrauchen texanus]|uniref:neuromedin-U receptor 1 n=1 Tax=Xyrauchen texanus TaxID=154827 RepID=UPI0022420A9B|nr:neuromedin-U receptor 1 [Xyrauchen texanus]
MIAKPNCSSTDSLQSRCVQELLCNTSVMLNFSELEMEEYCLNQDEYLEKYLGPRCSPLFLPVCITYLIIFLVGAVGNILTCTVISRNKVMRTPTNFYLFSLAVSDLLVLLLGMPLELYEMWSNYPFLLGKGGCYFKTFLFETVCFASILNVTALSVERYIAVVHPLRAKYVVTCTHAKRVILSIWSVSVLGAIPNTSLHGIFTLPLPKGKGVGSMPNSDTCMLVKPRWMYNLIIQITTLLFFLLPMLTISVVYLLIGMQLKREKMLHVLEAKASLGQDSYSNVHSRQQKTRRQQVTKMLFVLVVMFGICWAPFHTDRLMWSFMDQKSSDHMEIFQVYEYVHVISGVFFYLSSAINPILYNLMSTRFREMFKEVMCHHKWQPSPRKRSLSMTRVTMRSTVSEIPPCNGPVTTEGEDYGMYECQESKTNFS